MMKLLLIAAFLLLLWGGWRGKFFKVSVQRCAFNPQETCAYGALQTPGGHVKRPPDVIDSEKLIVKWLFVTDLCYVQGR